MPIEALTRETTVTIPETTAAFAANIIADAFREPNKRRRKTIFNKVTRGLSSFDLLPPGDVTNVGLSIAPDGSLQVIITVSVPVPPKTEASDDGSRT